MWNFVPTKSNYEFLSHANQLSIHLRISFDIPALQSQLLNQITCLFGSNIHHRGVYTVTRKRILTLFAQPPRANETCLYPKDISKGKKEKGAPSVRRRKWHGREIALELNSTPVCLSQVRYAVHFWVTVLLIEASLCYDFSKSFTTSRITFSTFTHCQLASINRMFFSLRQGTRAVPAALLVARNTAVAIAGVWLRKFSTYFTNYIELLFWKFTLSLNSFFSRCV